MKKYIVTLTKEEREVLGSLFSKGKHQSQKILNALILLDCDTGDCQTNRSKNEEIARVLNVSMRKIDRQNASFWAAMNNKSGPDALGMLERQRVKTWLKSTYATLGELAL